MTARGRRIAFFLGFSILAGLLIHAAAGIGLRSAMRAQGADRLERETALLAGLLPARLEGLHPLAPLDPDAQKLQEILLSLAARSDLRLTFIDPMGVVLADSGVPAEAIGGLENHSGRPEVREAMLSGVGRSTRLSMTIGKELTYVARRLDGAGPEPRGILRAAVPVASFDAGGGAARSVVAAAAALLILIAALIAESMVAGIAGPIRSIAAGAERVASGENEAPLRSGSEAEEVRRLEAGVDGMRRSLLEQIRRLREEKLVHATIFSGMREGLLAVDSARRVILANASLRRDLNLGELIVEGRPLTEVIRDPAVGEAFLRAIEERTETRVRIETRFPVERSFELLAAPLDSLEGAPIGAIGLFLDVTRLHALERMRREFIADVSHELRTPLASLKAAVENLLGPAGNNRPDREQFLAIVRRNAERMQALIDDLTDLSLIETEAITLEPTPVDLRESVADAVVALSGRAQSRGVRMVSEIPAGTRVSADRRRLDQILVNVLDNAVKFNHEGGSVRVSARREGDRVVVTVEDTGDGIPPGDLERIFQRFYRRDRSRSREAGGTGLGLSIVKHLMRLHSGSVYAENRKEGGARFVLGFQGAEPAQEAPPGR